MRSLRVLYVVPLLFALSGLASAQGKCGGDSPPPRMDLFGKKKKPAVCKDVPVKLKFALITRVTAETWKKIKPYARPGDLFWGDDVKEIPSTQRALAITSHVDMVKGLAGEGLDKYAAVTLNGDQKDIKKTVAEAQKIRKAINALNKKHAARKGYVAKKFIAVFDMKVLKKEPGVAGEPDVVLIGKPSWTQKVLTDKKLKVKPKTYLDMIELNGRKGGVILGSSKKATGHTTETLRSTIDYCLSEKGLAVKTIAYLSTDAKATTLLALLKQLR